MMGQSKHGAWLNILKFTVPISSIKIELPLASQKDTRNQTADIDLHAKVTDTAPPSSQPTGCWIFAAKPAAGKGFNPGLVV